MNGINFTPEDARAILERRGFFFRRIGSRLLSACPVGTHDRPEGKLAIHARNGTARIGCFACGYSDNLPAFICRLNGTEPRGQAYIEAIRECGVSVATDGKPRPRFKRYWSEWESIERATLPIAIACNFHDPADELKRFIESEVKAGHSPEGPYIRRLIEAVTEFRRRAAR